MSKRNNHILNFVAIVFAMVFALPASAQILGQIIKAGDERFAAADYYAASLYYKDALRKKSDDVQVQYKYAEASRMFNDYKKAAAAYAEVVKVDKANQFPMAPFWLGEMLKSTGKYDDAIKQFNRFTGRYKNKDYYFDKAQQELQSCAWVKDHNRQSNTIKIQHLGKEVNSEASEFNAVHVYPDRVQFSSLRNVSADKKKANYLVRIYNQMPNPDPVFTPEGANPNLNIGNLAYTSDVKRLYFTQCEQTDKVTSRCDIYVSIYQDFKWTKAEKLGEQVNDAKATNTHPALGYDQAGHEVLFFASDRQGGEGNMDIWMSRRNADGTYQSAINAGKKINSKGNEVTPFYDENEKKLYFSSDWHYGFGGYDVFEAKGELANWSEPENLLKPLNTPQNDLYYSMASDNSKVYLTSNRVGSYYIEAETCCNDIYAYATGKKIERVEKPIPPPLVKDTPVVINEPTPVIPETPPTPTTPTFPHYDTIIPPPTVTTEKLINEKLINVKQKVGVALYFHNDEPECCNMRDTTSIDYKDSYEAYSSLYNLYRREYPKGLKESEKPEKQKEIKDLFDTVDKGFYNLVAFSSQLYDLLQGGNKLEVTIKGYCSPLNFNEYNIKLGYRRTAALRNYFYHYRDGILMQYIANGKLSIVNESFGEETSAKEVSDNLKDKRNSVYSPAAALERRVEILTIEIK